MRGEGLVEVASRRYGLFAFRRVKQWWSFEGLDPSRKSYFVFLAMKALPVDFVSLTVIDYERDVRHAEEHFGKVTAAPGDRMDVRARGKWGNLAFSGSAEDGWRVEARTPMITADLTQRVLAAAHRNRLTTRRIDYNILQFVSNETGGSIEVGGRSTPFEGYGYSEHNWGVQPRHSAANWLHFWGPGVAGVVLDCFYDAGVHHHYNYLWRGEGAGYVASPAYFGFDPSEPRSEFRVASPDLDLSVRALTHDRNRMRVPPVLPYLNIDYHEMLVEVRGTALALGETVEIDAIGKYDHNFNLW